MKDYFQQTYKRLSLVIIAVCLPFIVWAVCQILPTFDDYTSLQSPWWVQIADPGYFFPDSVRRPFDALLGYIVGLWPALFPTLNHVLIILGHVANTLLVFDICRRLRLGTLATNIATLFFFFSPATLGTILACDGFNQTYAHFWGLMALWIYLRRGGGYAWLLCIVMAVFSKENGLAWAVVPPIFTFAFGLVSMRQAARDVGKGLLLAVAYFLLMYFLIHSGIAGIDYPEEYSETTLMSHVNDLVQLLAYTWVPLDYMSAVYAPTRNLSIVAVTAAMALPFLLGLLGRLRPLGRLGRLGQVGQPGRLGQLGVLGRLGLLVVCFFILVSPHLVTVVSIMHNYAALSMAAIIVATLLSTADSSRKCSTLHSTFFFLFLSSAIFTDVHHYMAARESGLLGRELAIEAIERATKPLERAMVISIDDPEEPRYSNFCVRPADAFAWGLAVRHYSHYTWKTSISEISIPRYEEQQVRHLADSALLAGNEAVWVVGKKPADSKSTDSLTIFSNSLSD